MLTVVNLHSVHTQHQNQRRCGGQDLGDNILEDAYGDSVTVELDEGTYTSRLIFR